MKNNEINENNGAVELFDEDSVISLFDEDENEIEFYEIASVEYKDKFYEILQPVEPLEGMEEDEAVIFEYDVDETTSEKNFKPVFDEELLNEIFDIYIKAAADDNCSHGDCGGCCGCGHDHDEDEEDDEE